MNFSKPLILAGVLLFIASCSKSDVKSDNSDDFYDDKTISERKEAYNSEIPGVVQSTESLSKTSDVPDRISFGFDSNALNGEQKKILDVQIAYIKKNSQTIKKIQISGYCDERGSIDYNLGLGSRRANAVKSYYVANGISADLLETNSYGKNVVLVEGHNEDAWKQNRIGRVRLCKNENC
jgi:outer membrane protein OmpA-like peptidoglycan-associated protein